MTKLFPSPLYRWTTRTNVRLGILYDPDTGKTSEVKPKKLNRRSRGRHNPGSAPYWNRWVEGNGAIAKYNSGRDELCLGCDWVFDPHDVSPNFYGEGSTCHESWNGTRYVSAVCYISNWIGPTGGQWVVEYGAQLIQYITWYPRWNQIGARVLSYSSGRIYCGDAGDKLAYQTAHSLYSDMFAYWSGATEEFFTSAGGGAGDCFGITDYSIINKEPRFSDDIYGLTERIEEGDESLSGLNVATATAFVNCIDQLPSLMSQNNVANIMDILSALRSFKDGLIVEKGAEKLLSSAWMGYRYAYGTTKADIQEISEVVDRLYALKDSSHIRAHGTSYTSDGWKVRCSLRITTDQFNGLFDKCEKWGLKLNGYALWDIVPYSFIIDWFADIGGWLEFSEKQKVSYRLDPSSCWYSIERQWTNEYGFKETYYQRFMWDVHQSLASYTSHGAGRVTVVKRALDLLAMILG